MNANALHVVDLLTEISLEQRWAIDQRAGPDIGDRDAADPDEQTGGPAKLALQHQETSVWQQRRVADVEIVLALERERARLRASDQKCEVIAGVIAAAFRDCHQAATQRTVARHENQRLD